MQLISLTINFVFIEHYKHNGTEQYKTNSIAILINWNSANSSNQNNKSVGSFGVGFRATDIAQNFNFKIF